MAFGLAQQSGILFEAEDSRCKHIRLRFWVSSCSCPETRSLHRCTRTISSQKHVTASTPSQHFNHFQTTTSTTKIHSPTDILKIYILLNDSSLLISKSNILFQQEKHAIKGIRFSHNNCIMTQECCNI